MSAYVGIQCDGCGTVRGRETLVQPSAGPVRKFLKDNGWHSARGTYQSVSGERGYARDICPTCWKAGVR